MANTGVRPGTVLLVVSGAAGLLAVGAALTGADVWRPSTVVAVLALAGHALVTGRGRLLAAGVALLAAATAIRHWWGDADIAWLPGLRQSEMHAELARHSAALLVRERLAAAVVLLATVALAAALARRPAAAGTRRRVPAAAAGVALVPGAVVVAGMVGDFRDRWELGAADAAALGWAAAPAVAAIAVAAVAGWIAARRNPAPGGRVSVGRAAVGGAVLLGAVAAVAADAVAGAWFQGVPYRDPPDAFLEPGIMIATGGGSTFRWDVDTALTAAVLLGAAALSVAGARPAHRDG